MQKKPKLLLISDVIRRDLHQPLIFFSKIEVIHLYSRDSYKDMKPVDFKKPLAVRWRSYINLYSQIAKIKPDILQGAEPWATKKSFGIAFVCLIYKILHRNTLLIWPAVENRPLKEKFNILKYIVLVVFTKFYSWFSDLIMYRNKGTLENLNKLKLNPRKLKWVKWATWGVDCNEFKPVNTKKKYDILFIGKVSHAKGFPWLLESYQQISKKRKVTFAFAGQPDNQKLVSRAVSSGAKYLGIVKNEDLPKIINEAKIVVAPSITTRDWEEQVGMVNLQAMACGVPVVSTNSGAIPEYISDLEGCLLVKEKNSTEIFQAIEKLFSSQKYYNEMSKKAEEYIVEKFEASRNIQEIEKTLMGLMVKKYSHERN